jgi:L-ascorbate metabolism protein UlaG (beta-lactamase superfamily)
MVELTYLSHSCFLIEGKDGNLIVDPFLSGNPLAPKDVKIKVNAILLTHGHGDHLGDAISIAKEQDALIVAPYELSTYCEKQGAKTHPMHIGGSHSFPFGKIKLTPAHHGSAVIDEDIIYTGNPCGFLIGVEEKTIYHAGDTGLMADMELIGRLNYIDVALLPIGDNFVMGIDDAVEAVKMLKPKIVIPMHYNTFPVIEQDPKVFLDKVGTLAKTVILNVGDKLKI